MTESERYTWWEDGDAYSNYIRPAVTKRLAEYEDIGTIEEFKAIKQWKSDIIESFSKYDVNSVDELMKRFCELTEKSEPKKPILCMNEESGMFVDYADGHGEYKTQMNNWWRCPCCHSVVGERVIVHSHIHDQRKKKFCEDCGTAIDWQ